MTTTPTKRRWFQIHLSTAVVLMITAGALLWANVRLINTRRANIYSEGLIWSPVGPEEKSLAIPERGWPLQYWYYGLFGPVWMRVEPRFHVMGLASGDKSPAQSLGERLQIERTYLKRALRRSDHRRSIFPASTRYRRIPVRSRPASKPCRPCRYRRRLGSWDSYSRRLPYRRPHRGGRRATWTRWPRP